MIHGGPLTSCSPYIVLRARCHRVGYACCFYMCVAPVPIRTAAGPYRHTTASAHYLRVPFPALMTATSPAAVLLVSRAEVRWLGYVHARGIIPLVCSKGQRDTPTPP